MFCSAKCLSANHEDPGKKGCLLQCLTSYAALRHYRDAFSSMWLLALEAFKIAQQNKKSRRKNTDTSYLSLFCCTVLKVSNRTYQLAQMLILIKASCVVVFRIVDVYSPCSSFRDNSQLCIMILVLFFLCFVLHKTRIIWRKLSNQYQWHCLLTLLE